MDLCGNIINDTSSIQILTALRGIVENYRFKVSENHAITRGACAEGDSMVFRYREPIVLTMRRTLKQAISVLYTELSYNFIGPEF